MERFVPGWNETDEEIKNNFVVSGALFPPDDETLRCKNTAHDVPFLEYFKLRQVNMSSGRKLGGQLELVYNDAEAAAQGEDQGADQEKFPNQKFDFDENSPPRTPPRIVRENSELRRKFLSTSSVKKQQKKEENCKFCQRICNSETLEPHLMSSSICRNLYLRLYRTNKLMDVLMIALTCINCSTDSKRTMAHLKKRENDRCLRRYKEILGVSKIEEVDRKLVNLRKKKKKSRGKAARKLYNDSYQEKLKESVSTSTAISNYRRGTVLANYKKCSSCSGHYLETGGREVDHNEDKFERYSMNQVFLCFTCDNLEDKKEIERKSGVFLLKHHELDNKIVFYPTIGPQAEVEENNNGGDETFDSSDGRLLSVLFPVCTESSSVLPEKIRPDPEIFRNISKCDSLNNRDISQCYVNQVLKYRNCLNHEQLFSGSIDDPLGRHIIDLKPVPSDFQIHNSDSWKSNQQTEMKRRFGQLGFLAIKLEVLFQRSDIEYLATVSVIRGKTLTFTFESQQGGEMKTQYLIHLSHSPQEPCKEGCRTVELEEYLQREGTHQDDNRYISVFTTTVSQKFNAFAEQIIKCRSYSLHSDSFHGSFTFDVKGNAVASFYLWPVHLQSFNKEVSNASYGKEFNEDIMKEFLIFMEATFSTSSAADELEQHFNLGKEKSKSLAKLVQSLQIDTDNKPVLPSLRTFSCLSTHSFAEENIEQAKIFLNECLASLSSLTKEEKLNMKTVDWLQQVKSRTVIHIHADRGLVEISLGGRGAELIIDEQLTDCLEAFKECKLVAVYHYCLTIVNAGQIVFKKKNLSECFTKMFDPTSLTALQARTSVKIVHSDLDWNTSDFGSSSECDMPAIPNLAPVVAGSHEEISITEAVSMMDSRKNRNISTPPMVYVNTNPYAKTVFKKVPNPTERSFTSDQRRGHFEVVFNAVSRHKDRLNGNNLLLCETACYYDFIGNDKSEELFNLFGANIERIPASEKVSLITGEKMPEMIVTSNHQVSRIRRHERKVLNFPQFDKDSEEEKYSRVLLFYPLPPGHDLAPAQVVFRENMLDLTSIGGTFREKDGDGTVLVSVIKSNNTSVKFIVQRCEDKEGRERQAVHRVIVDKISPEGAMMLVGEQRQSEGESSKVEPLVKRMEVSQYKGFNGGHSIDVRVDEYRFPRSVAELTNIPEKFRKCFTSTFSFKRINGVFTLHLSMKDCYRGKEINKEYFHQDKRFRKYSEPTMTHCAKVELTEEDIISHLNDTLMPIEDDYYINLVGDEMEAYYMDSQDDVLFPDPSQLANLSFNNLNAEHQERAISTVVEDIIQDIISAALNAEAAQPNSQNQTSNVTRSKKSVIKKYFSSSSAKKK